MRLLFALLLFPLSSWGSDNVALERFFSGLETLRGGFEQIVYDGNGVQIETSRGHFMVQRPGQFRWQTRTPYLQQVVGDGERIWIYDPDLEQVTVRKQQGALSNTPAMLLIHDGTLQQQFTLSPLDRAGPFEWVELAPKQGDGGFERLLVAMDGEQLRMIQVEDSLGQRTRIELLNLMRNTTLAEHSFSFVPPQGVDVVGDL